MTVSGQPWIMVVDDETENLRVMEELLGAADYQLALFPRADLALQAAVARPPDLALVDIRMPGMDGYEFCLRCKRISTLVEMPVIFVSALDTGEDIVRGFEAGGVDYVTKPFLAEVVLARVRRHLGVRRLQQELAEHKQRLERLVARQVRQVAKSQMATIFALAKLVESRDDITGQHIERVQCLTSVLAVALREVPDFTPLLGRKYLQCLTQAAALHDIGKMAIADHVLLKPGRLTAAEFAAVKEHARIGSDTLLSVHDRYPGNTFIKMGVEIARSHHERWDGGGYPDGLSGEGIPLAARIVAVADVYDALRATRPYKAAFSHETAMRIIMDAAGTQFDPRIAEVFSRLPEQPQFRKST